MLQGVTSFHELATPTWGFVQSSSVMPTARSMARAGARSNPAVTSRLRNSMLTMLTHWSQWTFGNTWPRSWGRPAGVRSTSSTPSTTTVSAASTPL